jgi:putative peptidoglycan lipid II flippase
VAAGVHPTSRASRSHATLVAAGILLSRLFGLVRQRALAHYLGLGDGSDAFNAAFRIPNLLQNLLGEGVLSASFIPVYARLRAEGREAEARQVAGAVFGLVALVTALIVLAGVALAGPLTDLIAPGWSGAKRDLTVSLVRLLFPGAGLLVASAWCLGVLNSHRRFLLSYSAPVIWNLAIIVALVGWSGGRAESGVATLAAVGSVVGSALQFLVQLPTVLRLVPGLRPSLATEGESVKTVIRNFGPVFLGRGVVQVSAFVDTIIASFLGRGAVAGLTTAQVLYTLPVSLFGMSVSAAELPAMSSATGSDEEIATALRSRLEAGLRRIAFFVVPSAAAFLGFGGLLAGALFQTGRFSAEDSRYVWAILAGSAVGLLAATMGRLYSSAYYALRDTRTPLRTATVRVTLGMVAGFLAAVPLPPLLGLEARWGAAGLTAASGLAAWVEFQLLRRGLVARLGPTGLRIGELARLWGSAALAVGLGYLVSRFVEGRHPVFQAAVVGGTFGVAYLAMTAALQVPEARRLWGRVTGR